jgi:hypothetical protein
LPINGAKDSPKIDLKNEQKRKEKAPQKKIKNWSKKSHKKCAKNFLIFYKSSSTKSDKKMEIEALINELIFKEKKHSFFTHIYPQKLPQKNDQFWSYFSLLF